MILHLSGRDGPGITAALSQCLADNDAKLIDLGQSLLHDFLNLSAIVDVPNNSNLIKELLVLSQSKHMRFEVLPFNDDNKKKIQKHPRLCITLLGELGPQTVATVTREIAALSLNLGEIKTLTKTTLEGLELFCESPNATLSDEELTAIKENLYKRAHELGCDISIQRDSIFRRNRRLVVFDVDSTFIPNEVVDELGALVGKGKEIAQITERAMAGELDFKQALEERVKLLKGLSMERAKLALKNIKPNPGVEKLIKVLRSLGCRMGLVSGGFDFFVAELRKDYGLDFSFSNKLEVVNGEITGQIDGIIVDANRKAQILRDMCEAYQCQLEQSVAVGDGSNDVDMLKIAGLGIAYQAKQKAQQAADVRFNHSQLDDILYLMGFGTEEINILNV
ncbi:MAG: phosphoserine phosphatase SerB [Bdellovibrionota bacterium]